jgi:hypothetical protein
MKHSFNPFLTIAYVHRDMSTRYSLFVQAVAADDAEESTISSLQEEQLTYIASCTALLEAIDNFISVNDQWEMKELEEQAIALLSAGQYYLPK